MSYLPFSAYGSRDESDLQRQGSGQDVPRPAVDRLDLIPVAVYQIHFFFLIGDCDDDEICEPEERLYGLEAQVRERLEGVFDVEEHFCDGEEEGGDVE